MTQSESAAADPALQTTALHSRHLKLGAKMSPFAGWDMPLWYKAGAIKEHLAVVTAAGLFDTSHMDVVFIEGTGSREFLDYAFTRELDGLRPGRVAYGAFLNRQGHCIDDGIVYHFAHSRHVVVVNAGMGAVVAEHLASLPGADKLNIFLPEPRLAKIDIQGPASVDIVRAMLKDPDDVLMKFPYFSFKGDFDMERTDVAFIGPSPVLLSRTGYTGELGFEVFLPANKAGKIWDRFLKVGEEYGILPCGLAARDSLRAGALLPLSHQDIGPWPFINHPWPFALPFAEEGPNRFTKDFCGADALDPVHTPYTLPFVGYDPRRVEPAEARVLLQGRDIGTVLTIVSDMAIGWLEGAVTSISSPHRPADWQPRGLACGFVKVDPKLEPGTEIVLKDNRREIKVEIVKDIRPDRTARKKLA